MAGNTKYNKLFNYFVTRRLPVLHTRLRLGHCTLNDYLFKINCKTSPICSCGIDNESVMLIFYIVLFLLLNMLQSLPKTMRQIVKVHITSSVHFPPRPPFNVDVTKNGYIANETSSAINATLKRVGGGRDEYSRGKVVQCLYNVFETTLSHSILSKIVYDIETCISILMINSTFNRYSSVSCNFFSIE